MKSLTIAFCTARKQPKFEWFRDSLLNQITPPWKHRIKVLVIDLASVGVEEMLCDAPDGSAVPFWRHPPKPNIWCGEHRITESNWWAKAAFLNTAICLCKTDWICFVDDRCVLMPGFLTAIKDAMAGDYAVSGTYEKRFGMKVEDGVITNGGEVLGYDSRKQRNNAPTTTYGGKWFGCCNALPLEWCIAVNGYDESTCGMRYEDTIFGEMLARNGYTTKFDPRMKVIQDRTMPESKMNIRGEDKGLSPNDKSHALLRRTDGQKRATHDFDIRAVREAVQRGEPFPPVDLNLEHRDWYDGMLVKDFDKLLGS